MKSPIAATFGSTGAARPGSIACCGFHWRSPGGAGSVRRIGPHPAASSSPAMIRPTRMERDMMAVGEVITQVQKPSTRVPTNWRKSVDEVSLGSFADRLDALDDLIHQPPGSGCSGRDPDVGAALHPGRIELVRVFDVMRDCALLA